MPRQPRLPDSLALTPTSLSHLRSPIFHCLQRSQCHVTSLTSKISTPPSFPMTGSSPFSLCLFPRCLRLLVTFCPTPLESDDLAPTLSESCSSCWLPKSRKYEQFIHTKPKTVILLINFSSYIEWKEKSSRGCK
jgi:hypothetical protein